MLFAVFAFYILPYSAQSAKFLNEEEKKLAFYRMQVDSSSVVGEKFVLKDALKIFKHPTSWMILGSQSRGVPRFDTDLLIGIEICLGVPLQSVSLYLPVIIKRLGYSAVKTNLFTWRRTGGGVMLLMLAFASDLTKIRFPFVAAGFAFTMIGFVIYATIDIDDINAAYFACFMMTWGTSAPSVILDVWYNNNNIANENKRVMLTSVGVPLANLMGVVC